MTLKYSANLTMLFTEASFLERFGLAAEAGFSAVEFLFPYEAGVENVRDRLQRHNLQLALFNLAPGDQPGEWGTLCLPGREDFFRRSLTTALEAALRLGCPHLNLMFGKRQTGCTPQAQVDCALENLAWGLPQAAQAGVTLMIEPLNATDQPEYFLQTTARAVEIIQQVNHPRLRLQYDVYHAQLQEGNLINTIRRHFGLIGHIQIADVPGRHQPGTGEIRYPAVFAALEELGYDGFIGLEYKPEGSTVESLAWLPREARKAPHPAPR